MSCSGASGRLLATTPRLERGDLHCPASAGRHLVVEAGDQGRAHDQGRARPKPDVDPPPPRELGRSAGPVLANEVLTVRVGDALSLPPWSLPVQVCLPTADEA